MRTLLTWIALVAASAGASFVDFPTILALPTASVLPVRERVVATADNGLVISAATCAATRWTGWLPVSQYKSVSFEMTTVDANDSVTNFAMRCEESFDNSVANDAGADLCCRSISGGVETYSCPCSKKYNPTNGGHWSWSFEGLNGAYLNCAVDCEGTQAAADTITVTVYGEL